MAELLTLCRRVASLQAQRALLLNRAYPPPLIFRILQNQRVPAWEDRGSSAPHVPRSFPGAEIEAGLTVEKLKRPAWLHFKREVSGSMETIELLRQATEDDVVAALKDVTFGNWPQDEADLLEFFSRMLDTRLGQDSGEDD